MTDTSSDWIAPYHLVTTCSRGPDTRDYDLVKSIWASEPHISDDLGNVGVGRDLLTYHSADAFADDAKVIHAPLLATMHRNSNHLGWYDDTYLRTDAGWEVKTRHFRVKWSEGAWIGARPLAEATA